MRELLCELTTALDRGQDCVYCSVVETRGSTPQKAGAAMLVFSDGSQRGTLGGGCVEAEVKQRALRVLNDKSDRPELLVFNLDDNYGWDDGLICGGRMSILAEPLPAGAANRPSVAGYFRRFHEMVEKGLGCTEVIVLTAQAELPVGERFLFDVDGKLAIQTGTALPVPQGRVPFRPRPGP